MLQVGRKWFRQPGWAAVSPASGLHQHPCSTNNLKTSKPQNLMPLLDLQRFTLAMCAFGKLRASVPMHTHTHTQPRTRTYTHKRETERETEKERRSQRESERQSESETRIVYLWCSKLYIAAYGTVNWFLWLMLREQVVGLQLCCREGCSSSVWITGLSDLILWGLTLSNSRHILVNYALQERFVEMGIPPHGNQLLREKTKLRLTPGTPQQARTDHVYKGKR